MNQSEEELRKILKNGIVRKTAPKPSKLNEILSNYAAQLAEAPSGYGLWSKEAHAQILALIEEVIGSDEEDDGFYSKEYIKYVNGEKAQQRLRKDAL